jgi:hypothetical protein
MADSHPKTFNPYFNNNRQITVRGCVSANQRRKRNLPGITLVELMVALFIYSLLFIFLLTTYGAFVKMSNFQQACMDLENQFMLFTRVIEKDVRLAGFNIPGNGLYAKNIGMPDFYFVALSNEENLHTLLSGSAQIGETGIKVTNASGTGANQWICLSQGSTIGLYRISRVGLNPGADTVVLGDSMCTILWKKDSTHVCFAKGIQYGVRLWQGEKKLIRTSMAHSSPIGPSVDSLSVCPKNRAGADLGNDFSQAKILGITLGGKVGPVGKAIVMTKSFDVELRNNQ